MNFTHRPVKFRILIPGLPALRPWGTRGRLALTALLLLGLSLQAATEGVPRVAYPESIREISRTVPAGRLQPRIMRMALSSDETTTTMDFEVALRMRNFAELQARVGRGEIIPREEMAAKYFPLTADYEQIVVWLTARGFTVTRQDPSHLSIFVRGPVNQIADVFQTTFVRVAFEGAEYTSAVTAPSVPVGLALPVLGINGLQPHLRPQKSAGEPVARKASLTSPNAPPYLPAEILKAYNADTANLTGAGQTIAIVIDTFVTLGDLTAFWSRCNISQSLGNIQMVQVTGAPTPPDPTQNDNGIEATIDTELTSSIAPAAKIRVYTTGRLSFTYLSQAYQQIYDDLPAIPGLNQVDLSYSIIENLLPRDQWQSDTQHFTTLASAGVTVFASSGDGGSRPDLNTGGYNSSLTLQPVHPASDPNVTGVGATTLTLDLNSGAASSETGWFSSNTSNGPAGSGGGISLLFSRPDWQTGPGVPSGTRRLVPDVSVVGDPYTGCYIVYTSSSYGQEGLTFGGTSISAPLWAGFGALINQARASAARTPLGLLGPRIYPLIATASLRDITSGSNGSDGVYTAGVGYDMVTGVGTPNIAALALALGAPSFAPTITTQPASQTVAVSQNAVFSMTANGNPPPSYRWQREPVGSTTWSDLSDSATYRGTATATLTVNSVTEAMSGDSFRCIVTNEVGSVTTSPATLIVASPLTIITLAGQAGSSGSADGTGSAARFNRPSDLAVDSAGNVYVTDTNNHTIRMITPAGIVSTVAGLAGSSGSVDGTGTAARFNYPTGIAVDGSGNLYVADTNNHSIRKITPAGAVTTFAGQPGIPGSADDNGGAARFNAPSDVTVDGASNVYVADTGNNTIREITSAGVVSTLAGLAGSSGSVDGSGSAARFSAPEGVAVDSAGNVYVADTNNSTIRKIFPAGAVSTLAGLAGTSGVSDGVGGGARFQYPSDLAVDGSGNLYVADTDNHTIRKISPAGATGTVAGRAGVNGSVDGTGSAARFYYPTGVAVDSAGNVYVADTNNNTIRKSTTATAPVITTQPQSQTVTAGTNVQFTVVATGTPVLTYQWLFNGSAISGATSSFYSLSNVQTTNAGAYTVVVTNIAGSVTSNQATLTVNAITPTTTISGGGGGGGTMAAWFVLTLALLCAARLAGRHRRV
jgi:sugar lactone lactonase YvrE